MSQRNGCRTTTPSTCWLVHYKPRCRHALHSGSFLRKNKGQIYGTKEVRLPLPNQCRERQTFPRNNQNTVTVKTLHCKRKRRRKTEKQEDVRNQDPPVLVFPSAIVEQGNLLVADLLVMTCTAKPSKGWKTLRGKTELPNSVSQPIRRVTVSRKESDINCRRIRCVDAGLFFPEAAVNKHSQSVCQQWEAGGSLPCGLEIRHVQSLHSWVCRFVNSEM